MRKPPSIPGQKPIRRNTKIQQNPKLAQWFQEGLSLHKQGHLKQAKTIYEGVLATHPKHFDALHLLGVIEHQNQNHELALELISRAIQINPNIASAYSNRGLALQELKQYDHALVSYDKAISLKSDLAEPWFNRGNVLQELKQYDQALISYDKAISLKPDYVDAWSNRGLVLQELKQYDHALASYDKAISLKPDYADAWSNRANALQELKLYDQALISYDKAISLKPDYAEAWNNRGNALQELKRYDQALISFDKAISLKPDYADAFWNKALARLLTADFQEGWTNYEYRWLRKNADKKSHQQFPSLTSLSELNSSTVLVWGEQGYGDIIQFSRYVTLLSQLGAHVVFEVLEPLKSLFKQAFPGIEIIGKDRSLGGIDFQVPLMSLPRLFSTDLSNIPSSVCYLKPLPDNLAQWRVKLNLNGSRPNIGIACAGAKANKNDKNRSMALGFFEPLLSVANLFLLQKDLRDSDKGFLSHHPEIRFLGEQASFEDLASIVELMDLIVTVDTSIAHLSGALGKPTKVMVAWNPEWRWLLDRQDSPWYPSIKIFRQPKAGDWESVIQEVISDLKLNAST